MADIETRVEHQLAIVTLNRPAKRNALTLAMWEELVAIFRGFGEERAVRAVILTGSGEHFCAGADIAEFSATRDTAEQGLAYDEAVDACCDAIAHVPKPTLAAVSGFCMGGGCGLAMACDFRFAAPGATFGIPAARLSIVYGTRETQNLLALVGLANAKRILFAAERIPAEEAARIGLVDRVVADPIAAARDFAAVMAQNAPLSIAGAKAVLTDLVMAGPSSAAQTASEVAHRAMASEDYREGRRAFLEKRAPQFKGE
jgi:enoyl-CoA hydratase/carnithine racemase